MMTFEQFQATRKWCDDLRTVEPDFYEDINQGVPHGFVYTDDCTIQRLDDGLFLLVIGNAQWMTCDLEQLERKLYEWVADEFGSAT